MRRVQSAYTAFLREWDSIQKKENDIKKELAAYVDKGKLKKVLGTIHSLKDK